MMKPEFGKKIPPRAQIVYMYLRYCAYKNNYCWPSYRKISMDLNISRSTVIRAVDDLKDAGMIVTHHRRRQSGAWSSLLYCFPEKIEGNKSNGVENAKKSMIE